MRKAFNILGLKPGASQELIKKAYRRLVKQYHPDIGGSADEFRKINDAYQQLMTKE
jgi:curved DNA-binding protein CbpA